MSPAGLWPLPPLALSLHHLAQCNTPVPLGPPAMVLSLQPLGPHSGTSTLGHLWWLSCIACPHPNPVFMAELISKHNETANLVCLNSHRGFRVLSPHGLVCDNPGHSLLGHRTPSRSNPEPWAPL